MRSLPLQRHYIDCPSYLFRCRSSPNYSRVPFQRTLRNPNSSRQKCGHALRFHMVEDPHTSSQNHADNLQNASPYVVGCTKVGHPLTGEGTCNQNPQKLKCVQHDLPFINPFDSVQFSQFMLKQVVPILPIPSIFIVGKTCLKFFFS